MINVRGILSLLAVLVVLAITHQAAVDALPRGSARHDGPVTFNAAASAPADPMTPTNSDETAQVDDEVGGAVVRLCLVVVL